MMFVLYHEKPDKSIRYNQKNPPNFCTKDGGFLKMIVDSAQKCADYPLIVTFSAE